MSTILTRRTQYLLFFFKLRTFFGIYLVLVRNIDGWVCHHNVHRKIADKNIGDFKQKNHIQISFPFFLAPRKRLGACTMLQTPSFSVEFV